MLKTDKNKILKKDIKKLHRSVKAVKKYQRKNYPDITEENDNGEWAFFKEFDKMCSAYLSIVKNYDSQIATKPLINDMLYAIARDNEASIIIKETIKYPTWFELLCKECIGTEYINTQWQFAEQLGNYHSESDAANLLFRFIESGNEYTERMALQSLCEHFPKEAEKYAVKFWNREIYEADEYQKIMALYALNRIKSPLLNEYIAKAYKTDYHYLKQWADEYSGKT